MSVKETLGTPAPTQFRLHQALRHISYAMQMDQPDSGVALQVRLALAQVRAHREGLRDQGRRAPDCRDGTSSADLLFDAARCILNVIQLEEYGERTGDFCRQAEAALRTWLRRAGPLVVRSPRPLGHGTEGGAEMDVNMEELSIEADTRIIDAIKLVADGIAGAGIDRARVARNLVISVLEDVQPEWEREPLLDPRGGALLLASVLHVLVQWIEAGLDYHLRQAEAMLALYIAEELGSLEEEV